MPSRIRLAAALQGIVDTAHSVGREVDDELALRLIGVYFGPKVTKSVLTPEQRAEAAGFLERLADEFILMEIEEDLRRTNGRSGRG